MNLLLDANIFLSFFQLSKSDLEEMAKLERLIDEGLVTISVTQQILDEFERGRELLVDRSLNELKKDVGVALPPFCRSGDVYEQFVAANKVLNKKRNDLRAKIESQASTRTLAADEIISSVIDNATILPEKSNTFDRALRRFQKGNPPQKPKDRNIGDALIWETILVNAKDLCDLHFVTADADYRSILNKKNLSPLLQKEWDQKSSGVLVLFGSLSEFFSLHFEHIKLSENTPPEYFIDRLWSSRSHAETQDLIAGLKSAGGMNVDQVCELIDIAYDIQNVADVLNEFDVNEIYRDIYLSYGAQLPQDYGQKLHELVDFWELR